jgi:AraC-like DNA-binding protein
LLPALPARSVPPSTLTTRRSPDPVLLWVRDGSARVEVDGHVHRVGAGQAIRVAAGVAHAIRTARGTVAVPIWLPAAVGGAGAGEAPATVLAVPPGWEPYLVHLFAQSLGYLRTADRTDLGLLDLMSSAGRVPAAPGAPAVDETGPGPASSPPSPSAPHGRVPLPPLPRSSDAFGIAHLLLCAPGTADPLDDLAARAGVSARTLQRRFVEETGLTLTAWRTRARLAAAAEYLAQGWDVGRVAAEVGFESASSFTRAFRTLAGVTPSAVRGPGPVPGAAAAPAAPPGTEPFAAVPPPLPPAETWPRVNGSHVAVWVYRGTAHAVVAERTWDLVEGDALVLPAGVSTHVRVDPGSLLLPLGFRTSAGAPISPDSLTTTRFTPADVPLLLHGLVATYTPLRPAGHRDAALFDEVAARTVRPAEVVDPHAPTAVAALAGYLAQHPLDRTTLAAWARRNGADPEALRVEFRAVTGTDFPQWRRLARMTRGREQLTRGLPPSVVARNLGYGHLSAFSRAFAAAYGMPPQRFQAEIRSTAAGVARRAVEAAAES